VPLDQKAHIVNIRDVPNDQGSQVVIRWTPSDYDAPSFRAVTGYRVWRRAPLGLTAARSGAVPAAWRREVTPTGTIVFWEPLVAIPAGKLRGYAFTAPTTQDSMEDSNPLRRSSCRR
jgi:hypothetical protein